MLSNIVDIAVVLKKVCTPTIEDYFQFISITYVSQLSWKYIWTLWKLYVELG